jgi:BASS family bile acid:Na+ symporter
MMSMDNSTVALIQAGSMVSTFVFVFSRGLKTRASDLRYMIDQPGLLLRSLLSVDLLVPLITLAILIIIQPARNVAVGLLLLASSPAAPSVLRNIAQAGGNEEYAISFHVALALLAIFTVPISLDLISYATGLHVDVGLPEVALVVGLSILLPIVAGMIGAWRFTATARHISPLLEVFSLIVLVLTVILLLTSTYQTLLTLDIRSYVAIILMTVGALAAGHLMARGQPGEQTTLALESATRNTGLTLLMATSFITLEKALPVLIPYIVTSAVICLLYIIYRRMAQKAVDRDSHQ